MNDNFGISPLVVVQPDIKLLNTIKEINEEIRNIASSRDQLPSDSAGRLSNINLSPLSLPCRCLVEKVIGGVLEKVKDATHASDGEMEGGQGAYAYHERPPLYLI